jgi:hypothetical protein
MSSIVDALSDRAVGAVESVTANAISVLIDPGAPQATALNTGTPRGFPRINGYLLIPNESGATVGVITSVRIERLPYPKRKGMQDFGLVDLPFPARIVSVTPLGTLAMKPGIAGSDLAFEVRRGVDVFPSVGDPVLLPTNAQLRAIVEGEASDKAGRVLLGTCPTAAGAPVYIDPDKLFGRHLAVLGNTGAGKSCTVAGLIRWSLEAARQAHKDGAQNGKPNARFIVLDPNGEYEKAFQDFKVRVFQVEASGGAKPLKVPAWLWNGEEWAAFTGAAPGVQRPILFDALRRLRSGAAEPDALGNRVRARVRRYQTGLKLRIHGGDHLQAGRREGVAQMLLNMAIDFVALVTEAGDGLRDRLQAVGDSANAIEQQARSGANNRGGFWHNDFSEERLAEVQRGLSEVADAVGLTDDEAVVGEDVPRFFPARELPGFVEALAADATGRDVSQFVDSLNLRIRGLFAAGALASVVDPGDSPSVTLDQWLREYVGADQASDGPIAVIDLSLVPSEAIHIVVAVLARMLFEAVQRHRRENGTELPTVLVLDEAHTFVHRDLTSEGAPAPGRTCCRTFERIAREGRKFGLGLVLASQRPSEVSPTVLSQCNTFLLHRIVNDRDQELVKHLVPDGLGDMLRELPSLPSRRAILLGWGAHAPVLIEIRELPEPMRPHSPDPAFWRVWTGEQACAIDWQAIASSWAESPNASEPDSGESENSK